MLNDHSLTTLITRFGLASIAAVALYLGNALAHGPATAGTDVPLTKTVHETAMVPAAVQRSFGGFEPPKGWVPPPLDPTGVTLVTKELSPGVYALLSTKPPVDNSGFVVGERGVLVIDAHINGAMARLIQAAVRRVTDKPILYLVNTNSHGDHTFGNYAFPVETKIVAHRKTAEAMRKFEQEKKVLLATVKGPEVFSGVRLRLPDVVFEESLRLDLGGRVVEVYHFGHGNTPGDTVVYVPEARVAWTQPGPRRGDHSLGHRGEHAGLSEDDRPFRGEPRCRDDRSGARRHDLAGHLGHLPPLSQRAHQRGARGDPLRPNVGTDAGRHATGRVLPSAGGLAPGPGAAPREGLPPLERQEDLLGTERKMSPSGG